MADYLYNEVLEKKFSKLFVELVDYCKEHKICYTRNHGPKNLEEVMQCPAYEQIVQMGPKVLPIIREAIYGGGCGNGTFLSALTGGLIPAVQEIVGEEFSIPEKIRVPEGDSTGFVWKLSCHTDTLCNYTYHWLTEYIFKH
jgi:hypothetical protein